MKKETIIWQAIIVLLGLLLIFTFRECLQDKNQIEARIGRANCLAISENQGLGIEGACTDIFNYDK